MRKHYNTARTLALSRTAKDTYIVFGGNLASAILGFLFTLLVARSLSVSDFGVFSAANNLIIIFASLTDVGISSGLVNFAAKYHSEGKRKKELEYVKAAFLSRLLSVIGVSLVFIVLAPFVSEHLLATTDLSVSAWVVVLSMFFFSWMFFPFVLQARRKFLESAYVDVSLGIVRFVLTLLFFVLGALTLSTTFISFTIGAAVGTVASFYFAGTDFLKAMPKRQVYSELFRFSGWLGVNRIVSSISGRLDVTMLAALAGATATGLYSIPQRIAFFTIVLAGSLTAVLATRFASISDKGEQKRFLLKSSLAVLPIISGMFFMILIAKPFIVLLFGDKYAPSVPVFQALVAALIPFMLTVPSVSAITYAMKKPVYIGVFSFFQIVAIFGLNYLFIPKYGAMGPTYTFAIVHTILAVYTWVPVVRYYWLSGDNSTTQSLNSKL